MTGNSSRLLILMNGSGLDELEEAGLRFELRTVGPLHVETSRHRAKWCWEWTARGVFEGLARGEGRLLADDAGTVDFFGMSCAVNDRPMAIEELDSGVTLIGNADRIEKEPTARWWTAVLRRIVRSNSNADAGGFGFRKSFEKITFGHGRDLSRRLFRERKCVRQ